MYTLTLTADERKAFDFVGHRYNSGEIAKLLWSYQGDDCPEWGSMEDITFQIPEFIAWGIKELAEEEDCSFPCFSNELKQKLCQFLDKII